MSLTPSERQRLHDGVCPRHRDTSPNVFVCHPCESAGDAVVEALIAERIAQRDEEWRRGRDALADHWKRLGKGDPPAATQVRAIEPVAAPHQ